MTAAMILRYYEQSYPPSVWGGGQPPPNPNAPTITSIAPTSYVDPVFGQTLTVDGTLFDMNTSSVWIDGNSFASMWVSATQLTASVGGPDLFVGTHSVTVRQDDPDNPGGDQLESNAKVLTVTATVGTRSDDDDDDDDGSEA
jgi:hypothetical protein